MVPAVLFLFLSFLSMKTWLLSTLSINKSSSARILVTRTEVSKGLFLTTNAWWQQKAAKVKVI